MALATKFGPHLILLVGLPSFITEIKQCEHRPSAWQRSPSDRGRLISGFQT